MESSFESAKPVVATSEPSLEEAPQRVKSGSGHLAAVSSASCAQGVRCTFKISGLSALGALECSRLLWCWPPELRWRWCVGCNNIDFNNDTSLFDPCDIDSYLLVFSEGPCTPCGV